MDQSILDWLLEEETPEVRLRTLKEYMKLPDDDEKVIECKKLLLQSKTYDHPKHYSYSIMVLECMP